MKKLFYMSIILLSSFTANSQSKKDLLLEMQSYIIGMTYNKSYDVEKEKLFQTLIVVGSERYGTSVKENLNRGYIEFLLQNEVYKETLDFEIIGDQKPYRIVITVKVEQRQQNLDGSLTNWFVNTNTNPSFIAGLHYKIYMDTYGPVVIPQMLIDKIDLWNDSQKKDKNKILKGRDY